MLPDITKATPEGRIIPVLALVVTDALTQEQGAVYIGCTPAELVAALDDPNIANAVDAEATRLRYSGDLANLKASRLTDSMLDKLLATPPEEISTGLAMKLAELGLKFREKAAPEAKPETPKMDVVIWHDGDPEPEPANDNRNRVTIRLKKLKPARTIEHEGASDAE